MIVPRATHSTSHFFCAQTRCTLAQKHMAMSSVQFYMTALNSHRKTSRVFGLFSFPFTIKGATVEKELVWIATLFSTFIWGYITHIYLLSALLHTVFIYEFLRVYRLRDTILTQSLINEEQLAAELERVHVDPNLPHEPPYITAADRKMCFLEALSSVRQ